jgi:hypothetical protein
VWKIPTKHSRPERRTSVGRASAQGRVGVSDSGGFKRIPGRMFERRGVSSNRGVGIGTTAIALGRGDRTKAGTVMRGNELALLKTTSTAKLLATAGSSASLGWVAGIRSPLLLALMPLIVIVMGAANGVAAGLQEGLCRKVTRWATGTDPDVPTPSGNGRATSEDDPAEPTPALGSAKENASPATPKGSRRPAGRRGDRPQAPPKRDGKATLTSTPDSARRHDPRTQSTTKG